MDELIFILKNEYISFEENVSLKTKTWIKRGGMTKLWIQPDSKTKLITVLKYLYCNNISFEIIGNTSNCYFTENYNPHVTVSTLKVCDFDISGNVIKCGCGYNLIKLTKFCIENEIAGYEGFIGLPGTVGGAAINNAGSYGSIISEVVSRVELITPDGEIIWLSNSQLGYKHRYSHLKSSIIKGGVLSVEFDISRKGVKNRMLQKASEFINHRKTHQENQYLNLGSIHSELDIFKNKWAFKTLLLKILIRITNIFFKEKTKIIRKYFFFYLYRKFSLVQHVSDKCLNCFIWKNQNLADDDFFDYLNLIKKVSKNSVLEVQIKK